MYNTEGDLVRRQASAVTHGGRVAGLAQLTVCSGASVRPSVGERETNFSRERWLEEEPRSWTRMPLSKVAAQVYTK